MFSTLGYSIFFKKSIFFKFLFPSTMFYIYNQVKSSKYPKKQAWNCPNKRISAVELLLNNRPEKCLNHLTSIEV
jgi:hypothetical protein